MSPLRVIQALRTPEVKNGIFFFFLQETVSEAPSGSREVGGTSGQCPSAGTSHGLHQSLLYSMSGSGRIYGMGGTQDNGCLSPAPQQPVPTVSSSRACSTVGKVSSREFQALFPHGHLRPGLTHILPGFLILCGILHGPPQADRFSKQKRKERKQLKTSLCLACSKDGSCCSHQPLGSIRRVVGGQNLGSGSLAKLNLVTFPWSAVISKEGFI